MHTATREALQRDLLAAVGPDESFAELGAVLEKWRGVLTAFRQLHGTEGWAEAGSGEGNGDDSALARTQQKLDPALQLLTFLGVGPNEVLCLATKQLCDHVRQRVPMLSEHQRAQLLDACFLYVEVPELQPVVMEVMDSMP